MANVPETGYIAAVYGHMHFFFLYKQSGKMPKTDKPNWSEQLPQKKRGARGGSAEEARCCVVVCGMCVNV